MPAAVVIEALRTPRGAAKESGALHGVSPMELLAGTLRALQSRTGVNTAEVADGVFGCVTQTGEQGGNIGKSACLLAGWSPTLSAVTINRYCASGLSAVNWAAQQARDADMLAVAGGVEMMSRVPLFGNKAPYYTGAMLVSGLLDEMEKRGLRYGVAALPGAFGVATATVFERST